MATATVPAAVLAAIAKLPWTACAGCRVRPAKSHQGGKYWSVGVYACDQKHGSIHMRSWDYVLDAQGRPVGSGLADKVIDEAEGRPW